MKIRKQKEKKNQEERGGDRDGRDNSERRWRKHWQRKVEWNSSVLSHSMLCPARTDCPASCLPLYLFMTHQKQKGLKSKETRIERFLSNEEIVCLPWSLFDSFQLPSCLSASFFTCSLLIINKRGRHREEMRMEWWTPNAIRISTTAIRHRRGGAKKRREGKEEEEEEERRRKKNFAEGMRKDSG